MLDFRQIPSQVNFVFGRRPFACLCWDLESGECAGVRSGSVVTLSLGRSLCLGELACPSEKPSRDFFVVRSSVTVEGQRGHFEISSPRKLSGPTDFVFPYGSCHFGNCR